MLVVLLPFFKSLDDFVELWDIYFIPFPSPLIFLESKKKIVYLLAFSLICEAVGIYLRVRQS